MTTKKHLKALSRPQTETTAFTPSYSNQSKKIQSQRLLVTMATKWPGRKIFHSPAHLRSIPWQLLHNWQIYYQSNFPTSARLPKEDHMSEITLKQQMTKLLLTNTQQINTAANNLTILIVKSASLDSYLSRGVRATWAEKVERPAQLGADNRPELYVDWCEDWVFPGVEEKLLRCLSVLSVLSVRSYSQHSLQKNKHQHIFQLYWPSLPNVLQWFCKIY